MTAMAPAAHLATTDEEREQAFRLRYDVYIRDHGFDAGGDDDQGVLADESDDRGHLLLAKLDGQPAGTCRITFGADESLDEFDAEFGLSSFAGTVSRARMAVVTRLAVAREHRGTEVPFVLIAEAVALGLRRGVELAFCACQPHLISAWTAIGCRPYRRTFDEPIAGLVIPLALIGRDVEHQRRISSPLLPIVERAGPSAFVEPLRALLPATTAVRPASELGAERIASLLGGGHGDSVLAGLESGELAELLVGAHVLEPEPGDRLICAGQRTRTLFVILSGAVDVHDGGQIHRRGPGEVVGDLAFLLRRPRTADVVVGAEGATVLSLSAGTLEAMLDRPAQPTAVLMLNIARTLASRLAERCEG